MWCSSATPSAAEEVDEETFFRSRETGGTVVSTALERDAAHSAEARYPREPLEHLRRPGLGRRQFGSDDAARVTC